MASNKKIKASPESGKATDSLLAQVSGTLAGLQGQHGDRADKAKHVLNRVVRAMTTPNDADDKWLEEAAWVPVVDNVRTDELRTLRAYGGADIPTKEREIRGMAPELDDATIAKLAKKLTAKTATAVYAEIIARVRAAMDGKKLNEAEIRTAIRRNGSQIRASLSRVKQGLK